MVSSPPKQTHKSRSDISGLIAMFKVSQDTILRLIQLGSIKGIWKGPRKFTLAAGEMEYLEKEWATIDGLRKALRTEPLVRTAILFGSHSIGSSRPDSDIDLFVGLKEKISFERFEALRSRLNRILGVYVDLYADYEIWSQPLLIRKIAEEGRPLIKREIGKKTLAIGRRAARGKTKLLEEFKI